LMLEMLSRLGTAIRAIWRRDQWERELRQELADHVADRAADLERRGLPRSAALRQARLELGPAERYREEARAASGVRLIDEASQDLRYILRTMVRAPMFAAMGIGSIALGVGANTIVVSVVNSVVVRPLPVRDPGSLYFVEPNLWATFSFPNYRDLRA